METQIFYIYIYTTVAHNTVETCSLCACFTRLLEPVSEGRRAALAGSRMNGLLSSETTLEQTTGTIPLAFKTITTATLEDH